LPDRPAFYLIRRPLVPILARAHYARTRQWGSWDGITGQMFKAEHRISAE
jgi:hypothetical protein